MGSPYLHCMDTHTPTETGDMGKIPAPPKDFDREAERSPWHRPAPPPPATPAAPDDDDVPSLGEVPIR